LGGHLAWGYSFNIQFPKLYSIARDKEAYVADHMQQYHGTFQWQVNFVRAAHDWELESFSTFFELIYSAKVSGQGEDRLCWKNDSQKEFEVRLFYRALTPFFFLINKNFIKEKKERSQYKYTGSGPE
jgi:hypothetical protein